jgi:hypothetical protein
MQTDSMVQTALTVKKLGVLATAHRIEAPDDSPEAARRTQFVQENFARMEGSLDTILMGAMDAFAKGWSIQECVYEPDGEYLWLRSVQPKDPATFGVELDEFGAMVGLRLEVPGEPAQALPREKFIVYRHRASYGKPKGRSDLDAAYPHFRAKGALLGKIVFDGGSPVARGPFVDPNARNLVADVSARGVREFHTEARAEFVVPLTPAGEHGQAAI